MSEALETTLEEGLEEVIVLDDTSAEMMVQRIKEAEEQYDRMKAWYEHQLQKAKEIHDNTVEWAKRNLQGYLGIVPARQTKTETKYELPGATLVLKKQQPKFTVKDDEMVPWLKENGLGEFVKTTVTEKAAWGELKKTLTQTPTGEYTTEDGEFIPGLTVTQQPDEFQVKLK